MGQASPRDAVRQATADPALRKLCARLRVDAVVQDLGGEDNLIALVDSGRHVLRTYKPFVPRRRLAETQQLRSRLAAGGLCIPTPIQIGRASMFRRGPRWAEVEPCVDLPSGEGFGAETLFRGLGRLHRALVELPTLTTHDLRQSFVSAPRSGDGYRPTSPTAS